jgi:hypothetical protein
MEGGQKTEQGGRGHQEEGVVVEEEQEQRTAQDRKGTVYPRSNSFCRRLRCSCRVRRVGDHRIGPINRIRESREALLGRR